LLMIGLSSGMGIGGTARRGRDGSRIIERGPLTGDAAEPAAVMLIEPAAVHDQMARVDRLAGGGGLPSAVRAKTKRNGVSGKDRVGGPLGRDPTAPLPDHLET